MTRRESVSYRSAATPGIPTQQTVGSQTNARQHIGPLHNLETCWGDLEDLGAAIRVENVAAIRQVARMGLTVVAVADGTILTAGRDSTHSSPKLAA